MYVLILTLFTSIIPIKMWSQTAYAEYDSNTLTFKYGTKPNNSTSWVIPKSGSAPDWLNYSGSVTRVVFDTSFASARPQTCSMWFKDFEWLTQIENIENLNTSETTDMWGMFYNCKKLASIDFSNFATYKATDMGFMFYDCQMLESLNLSTFNTYLVTNMNRMFANCIKLSNIIFGSLFDTRKVTDMGEMFSCCTNMKRIDLTCFNTLSVENMNGMFAACKSLFTVDLSTFNTSKVTDMSEMFMDCDKLKRIDIHNFNIQNLTSTVRMFSGCDNLEKIICDDNWSSISESTNMFHGCTNLVGAVPYNSSNIDATYANKTTGYFSPFYYYIAELSNDGKTLTFRRSSTAPNGTTQWDATKSGYEEIDTNPNPDNDDYEPDYTFHGLGVEKVVFDESFADARPNSCYCWFVDNTSLTKIIGLEYLNTSEVINMEYMFYRCNKLASLDLRSFDVSNTEKMGQMFYQCTNLETIACDNDWNSIQVTSSGEMFWGCPKLSGAIDYNNSKTDVNFANPTDGYFASTSNYNVNITVPSFNICTYSSLYDLDFSSVSGLTAYVISSFNAGEGTLTLTPATTVQAGEGLLLKGNAGEYVVPRTTTDATYTNYLVGVPNTTSVSPTDGDYTNFILANGSHGINFYVLSKTGNIAAGKAYLQLPTAALNQMSLSKSFSIIDGLTSITNVEIEKNNSKIFYDLQGRRVEKPTKGLYIVNGKKVIIK